MVVGLGICTFTSSLGRCDVLPSSMSISLVLQSVDVFFPPVIRNKMHRKKSTLTREGEKEKENHELKNEICTRDIQDKKITTQVRLRMTVHEQTILRPSITLLTLALQNRRPEKINQRNEESKGRRTFYDS